MKKKSFFYLFIVVAGFGVFAYLSQFSKARFDAIERATDTRGYTDSDSAPPVALTSPSPGGSPAGPTEHDRNQLKILDDVLASKNDNDPRLDTTLRFLSPAAKELMRQRYQTLPSEKRNQRGTIVFLIGRDMNSPDDAAFLGSVLAEPPCLSMADCSREVSPDSVGDDPHAEMGSGISLAYPQMVALQMLEKQVSEIELGKPSDLIENIKKSLEAATHSQTPSVANKAFELLARLNRS